jgi:hypothetical protein
VRGKSAWRDPSEIVKELVGLSEGVEHEGMSLSMTVKTGLCRELHVHSGYTEGGVPYGVRWDEIATADDEGVYPAARHPVPIKSRT